MTDLRNVSTKEIEEELRRRNAMPRCICGKWQTYIGPWDSDGNTIRCYGCLKAISKCTCV